jgi:hypothetical protein
VAFTFTAVCGLKNMYLKKNKIKRVRPILGMTLEFFLYIVYKEKPDLLSYNFLIKT